MKKNFTISIMMIFSIIISSSVFADVTVDGFCYLDGETNYSGTKVLFTADSPTANTDSVYTITDGSFSIGLSSGIYKVSYSHDGWVADSIAGSVPLFAGTTLDPVTLALADFREVIGSQSGIWTPDSIYHVIGNISIDNGDSLIIEPGTIVKFMDYYSFEVYGLLRAIATDTDSIYFTTGKDEPDGTEWTGITFKSSSNENSIVSFVGIEYAFRGIRCESSSPSIISNTINSSFTGIYCESSSSFISHNVITNNSYEGISCQYSSPTINNNTISDNYYVGIRCQNQSSPIISYNTINGHSNEGIICNYNCIPAITYNTINSNNTGIDCRESVTISNNIINNSISYGIRIQGYSPTVINNTISNGNRGIYSYNSNPFILNNILIGNETGLDINDAPSSLEYNLLWDNNVMAIGAGMPAFFGELLAVNANGDSCDAYLNLFMDPLMVDPDHSTFDLMPNSPCVDAGNPDPAYNDPDGTIADIGALYHDQNMPFANFDANKTEGYFPLTVNFADISLPVSAPIVDWLWDFGDGNTSTLQNPTHIFTNDLNNHVQLFTVSLVITDSDGLSNSITKTGYVEVRKSIINIPDNYATIQEGIDAALNSDTVLVAPGIYFERINFNGKNITVASMFINTQDTSYISQTIIDGDGGYGSVVTFESNEDSTSLLLGFTITNGVSTGGGISIENSSPVISYCTISGNDASYSYHYGGGIAWTAISSPRISNCTLSWNSSTNQGGGIYAQSTNATNPPLIENCIIGNNSGVLGAGLYIQDNTVVKGCQVIDNNAINGDYAKGGGFYCNYNASPTIENCVISGNSSDNKSGAIYSNEAYLTIINSIIEGNYGNEAIFFVYYPPVSLAYCDFYNNEGADFDGSIPNEYGVIVDVNFNNDSCDLFNNIFLDPAFATTKSNSPYHLSENSPCRNAGDPNPMYNDPDGTYADIGAFYFEQTTPLANFETDTEEGYFPLAVSFTDISVPVISPIVDWHWDFGDGNTSSVQNPIHIYQNKGLYDVSFVVTDSDNNTDTLTRFGFINAHESIINVPGDYLTIQGGIDAAFNGDTVLVDPGVYVENINFNGKNITVASLFINTLDTSFISQTIIDGGGIFAVVTISSNEDSTSMISGFTVRNGLNSNNNGGGLNVFGASPQINYLTITDNNVGGNLGGGIYLDDSKSVVSNCNILNNSAGAGGGLYVNFSSFVKLVNNNISSNYASSNGGGIYIYGCSPSLINNLISNNWSDNATSGAGGVRCYYNASPVLINNTIVNNSGTNGGGLRAMDNSNPILVNNIIWGNTATVSGDQIRLDDDTSDPDFMNCDIEGGIAGFGLGSGAIYTGTYDNCIETDPLFGDYLNGDYQLTGFSPCINTGTPDTTGLGLPQFDLVGNTRVIGNIIDIGCYEYALTGEMYIVRLNVFFEGPFTGTEMITFLNLFGQIPLTHPYNGQSWNYNGNETVPSIPNSDVVDWVLVELRDAPDAGSATTGTLLSQQVGFILKDGSIVRIDGASDLQFNLTVAQQLFAVMYHRNHVPVISANPLTESNGVYIYDFTDDVSKAFGGDKAQKEISPGVWGMMAGDANGDGQVSNADKNDFWSVQEGTAGYLESDFGMDGPVNSLDMDKWELNSGKGTQVPE